MSERLPFDLGELRTRTVRGVGINGAFLALVEAAVLAQGLIVARVLGPSEVGLYGIVSITVMTLVALKRVGIDEAYVYQEEADQELEFQRAFSLELALSALFSLLILATAPVLVAVYDEERLLWLTVALAYLPIAFALQAPLWIFFRRMDFLRQRSLQAVVPVVAFAVTVPLVLNDFGVWSLVVGALAGNLVAAVLAIALSPYRLRLRFDGRAARRYLAFSWPVLVVTAAGLVVNQGQVLALKLEGGLAAAGFLSLAVALTRYADRADTIISPAIYPAICAVRDRLASLERMFVASTRLAAVWALGYGALFLMFAPDLVEFVLGDDWDGAVVLLQGLAVSAALYQLGFGWFAFTRGMGRPRPQAVEAGTGVLGFLLIAVPALVLFGRTGFVLGTIAASLGVLGVRSRFVHQLLPGVPLARLAARALWPVAAGCCAVATLRLALWGGDRTAAQALGELAVFLATYAAATLVGERDLARELVRSARAPAAGTA